jgi:predicted RNA-binding protein with PIN domain
MLYLIDGHNLIPKIKNLSLKDLNDEEKLISLLNRFSTKARAQVEVFFDGAPAGFTRAGKTGAIKTVFVKSGSSADEAMIERIKTIKISNTGVTVVSSDHTIQIEARRMRFNVISSQEFSILMEEKFTHSTGETSNHPTLSDSEIQEWLDLFGKDG